MTRVVIDGNIGAGKTTQLDLLERKGWRVRREPIDQWPLEEFYKDPKRWAFLLHMRILQTSQPLPITKGPIIYERSLLSSRWVFWAVMKNKDQVTDIEDKTYEYYYDSLAWRPDVYIFLNKDVDVAWEHIQSRHQVGDSEVTREYWLELDKEYKKLITHIPCKVYVVNANRSVVEKIGRAHV